MGRYALMMAVAGPLAVMLGPVAAGDAEAAPTPSRRATIASLLAGSGDALQGSMVRFSARRSRQGPYGMGLQPTGDKRWRRTAAAEELYGGAGGGVPDADDFAAGHATGLAQGAMAAAHMTGLHPAMVHAAVASGMANPMMPGMPMMMTPAGPMAMPPVGVTPYGLPLVAGGIPHVMGPAFPAAHAMYQPYGMHAPGGYGAALTPYTPVYGAYGSAVWSDYRMCANTGIPPEGTPEFPYPDVDGAKAQRKVRRSLMIGQPVGTFAFRKGVQPNTVEVDTVAGQHPGGISMLTTYTFKCIGGAGVGRLESMDGLGTRSTIQEWIASKPALFRYPLGDQPAVPEGHAALAASGYPGHVHGFTTGALRFRERAATKGEDEDDEDDEDEDVSVDGGAPKEEGEEEDEDGEGKGGKAPAIPAGAVSEADAAMTAAALGPMAMPHPAVAAFAAGMLPGHAVTFDPLSGEDFDVTPITAERGPRLGHWGPYGAFSPASPLMLNALHTSYMHPAYAPGFLHPAAVPYHPAHWQGVMAHPMAAMMGASPFAMMGHHMMMGHPYGMMGHPFGAMPHPYGMAMVGHPMMGGFPGGFGFRATKASPAHHRFRALRADPAKPDAGAAAKPDAGSAPAGGTPLVNPGDNTAAASGSDAARTAAQEALKTSAAATARADGAANTAASGSGPLLMPSAAMYPVAAGSAIGLPYAGFAGHPYGMMMGHPMMGHPMMGHPMMGHPYGMMMGHPYGMMMGHPMMGHPYGMMMGRPMMGHPMMGHPYGMMMGHPMMGHPYGMMMGHPMMGHPYGMMPFGAPMSPAAGMAAAQAMHAATAAHRLALDADAHNIASAAHANAARAAQAHAGLAAHSASTAASAANAMSAADSMAGFGIMLQAGAKAGSKALAGSSAAAAAAADAASSPGATWGMTASQASSLRSGRHLRADAAAPSPASAAGSMRFAARRSGRFLPAYAPYAGGFHPMASPAFHPYLPYGQPGFASFFPHTAAGHAAMGMGYGMPVAMGYPMMAGYPMPHPAASMGYGMPHPMAMGMPHPAMAPLTLGGAYRPISVGSWLQTAAKSGRASVAAAGRALAGRAATSLALLAGRAADAASRAAAKAVAVRSTSASKASARWGVPLAPLAMGLPHALAAHYGYFGPATGVHPAAAMMMNPAAAAFGAWGHPWGTPMALGGVGLPAAVTSGYLHPAGPAPYFGASPLMPYALPHPMAHAFSPYAAGMYHPYHHPMYPYGPGSMASPHQSVLSSLTMGQMYASCRQLALPPATPTPDFPFYNRHAAEAKLIHEHLLPGLPVGTYAVRMAASGDGIAVDVNVPLDKANPTNMAPTRVAHYKFRCEGNQLVDMTDPARSYYSLESLSDSIPVLQNPLGSVVPETMHVAAAGTPVTPVVLEHLRQSGIVNEQVKKANSGQIGSGIIY